MSYAHWLRPDVENDVPFVQSMSLNSEELGERLGAQPMTDRGTSEEERGGWGQKPKVRSLIRLRLSSDVGHVACPIIPGDRSAIFISQQALRW